MQMQMNIVPVAAAKIDAGLPPSAATSSPARATTTGGDAADKENLMEIRFALGLSGGRADGWDGVASWPWSGRRMVVVVNFVLPYFFARSPNFHFRHTT